MYLWLVIMIWMEGGNRKQKMEGKRDRWERQGHVDNYINMKYTEWIAVELSIQYILSQMKVWYKNTYNKIYLCLSAMDESNISLTISTEWWFLNFPWPMVYLCGKLQPNLHSQLNAIIATYRFAHKGVTIWFSNKYLRNLDSLRVDSALAHDIQTNNISSWEIKYFQSEQAIQST